MEKKRLTAVSCLVTIWIFFIAAVACCAMESSPEEHSAAAEAEGQEGLAAVEHANDPLEPVNRAFFAFNDTLYFWFLKPVATVLDTFVPTDVRIAIRNAVHNATAPIRIVNNLLQGKLKETGNELSRFLINSTAGIVGLGDPAANEFGIRVQEEDFGQTLGRCGMGAGPYICWPLLGPSNLRDTFGFAVDTLLNPFSYFGVDNGYTAAGISVGRRVNHVSLNLHEYEDFKDAAIDPYVSLRDAYLQYRISQVADRGAEADTVPFSEKE